MFGLFSSNTLANPTTPFYGAGGAAPVTPVAPNQPPSVPELVSKTSNQIIVSFNVDGVTGTPTPTYSALFGPPGTLFLPLSATLQPDGTYQATATNLLPGVNYVFQSVASNSAGSENSVSSAVIQTNNNSAPPSQAPTIPILQSSTSTSITVNFDITGITGTDPISYSILYGSSQTPTTSVPALLVSGTTYSATVSGLTTGTTYYFESVASNAEGSQTSAVSLGYSTSGSSVIPPTSAASIPVLVSKTATSFTVNFDIAGVVAQPSTTNTILYGTSTSPNIPAPAVLISGTIYQAVLVGLTPGATYYVKSFVSNSGGSQLSAVSSAIVLPASNPLPSAPAVPVISGSPTSTSITVTFDTAGQTSTSPVTYSIYYGLTSTPATPYPATRVGTSDIYQAIVTGLSPATQYYFAANATNAGGSTASATAGPFNTAATGAIPPSSAPTVPVVYGSPTSSAISVTFNVAGISGTAPIKYNVLYGITNAPTIQFAAVLQSGTTYIANVTGLTASTPYYFKSEASNPDGVAISSVSTSISTAAASSGPSPPAAPAVSGTPTTNSIAVTFDTAGQTGTAPVTYSVVYGTTSTPTIPAPAVLQSGTIYSCVIGGLLPSTPYYFRSVATNSVGSIQSTGVATSISTAAAPVAPSAPSVPANFGTQTSTSITVRFDAAGQTGTAPVTYGLFYGTTNNPTTSWPVSIVSGTVYQAVLTGLTPSTAYYFKSVSTNVLASTPSAVSASISTGSGGSLPSQAPTKPIVDSQIPSLGGSKFAQFYINVNGVTSLTPVNYSVTYGTTTPPTTIVNAYPIAQNISPSTLFPAGSVVYGTPYITGLTPSTQYVGFSSSINDGGHVDSAVNSTLLNTPAPSGNPDVNLSFNGLTLTNGTTNGQVSYNFSFTGSESGLNFIGIVWGYSVNSLNAINIGQVGAGGTVSGVANMLPGAVIYAAPFASGDNIQIGTPTAAFTVAGGVAPSGIPSVPVVSGTPTTNSISVQFDVSQVTGTAPLSYSVLYGTTNTPTTSAPGVKNGNTVTASVTGLTASTPYYFIGVVTNSNGNVKSAVSAAISTAGGAGVGLKTYAVTTFLVAGPVYNTPYSQCINYYLGCDAVGGTLNANGQVSGKQLFGSWYANTYGTVPSSYGFPSFSGKCLSDIDQSDTGALSYTYLHPLQTAGAKVLASLGGFYMDMRGLWKNDSYQVPNFPGGTMPTVTQFINSVLNVFFAYDTPKLSGWSSSGWAAFTFDGLNIDFENIGQGGNPNVSNTYPPTPGTAPTFPANATDPQYSSYMTDIVTMLNIIYTSAPGLILTHAPLSLSINADSLTLQGGKNVASTTNLNTWFAFTGSNVAPTTTSFNSTASIALNNPAQMAYFDDIFVQFYNESPDNYLGGVNFANLLAQWGFCALKAQALGKKKTKINIGLAKGIIQGSTANPSVANSQGPTPGISPAGSGPYTYWYPQYQTASPPNPSATQPTTPTGFLYPNIGVDKDASNLQSALSTANILLRASGLPDASFINISDWCSGAGFWAGGPATSACKSVFKDVSNLPQGVTYAWSDAQYPAPDPQWANNLPIQL